MEVAVYTDVADFAAAVEARLIGLGHRVARVDAPERAELWLLSYDAARDLLKGAEVAPVVAVASLTAAEHTTLREHTARTHLVHPDERTEGGWATSPEKAADAWHGTHEKIKLPWRCLGEAPEPDAAIVAEFAKHGRRLADNVMINRPTDGCMSVRGDGGFWITATGTPKADVRAENLVWVEHADATGLHGRSDGRRPSSGTPWHAAIYAERPDVTAIVHGHCRRLTYGDGLEGVRTEHYAPYGTMAVYESMRAMVPDVDFLVLTGHGEVSMGRSLEECLDRYCEIAGDP